MFDMRRTQGENEPTMTIREFIAATVDTPRTPRMPALFIGHGSPMNGVDDTVYGRSWEELGKTLPRPKAICVISAHWLTRGTFVHVAEHPKTIHDFYGFPSELYDITYPAPGSPYFAEATQALIDGAVVERDLTWGLDHGAWIVLHKMYPDADIPVFQLSIDMTQGAAFHYALGKELQTLREHGVLILGSGNIVHNLRLVDFSPTAPAFDWATRFDTEVAERIMKGDHEALINYETLGPDALRSIPTPDHYYPLLYILGCAHNDDSISFPTEGIDLGSIAMRSVLIEKE